MKLDGAADGTERRDRRQIEGSCSPWRRARYPPAPRRYATSFGVCPSPVATPAGAITVSPLTATPVFVPAGSCFCHTRLPVRAVERVHHAFERGREHEVVDRGDRSERGPWKFLVPLDHARSGVHRDDLAGGRSVFLDFGLRLHLRRVVDDWHEHRRPVARHRRDHAAELARVDRLRERQLREFRLSARTDCPCRGRCGCPRGASTAACPWRSPARPPRRPCPRRSPPGGRPRVIRIGGSCRSQS